MLPSSSFAAFIGFHHEFNTFAYAKSLQNLTGGYNDDGRVYVTVGKSLGKDNVLGYFTVRSCEDASQSIVVQLSGRVPFTHVLINSTQGQLIGFSENQEVILEPVTHTVCESVEIIPCSAYDFNILDQHSSIVEEELLQQISIVRKGAILPFWVSPSVSALFRIGQIIPETDLPVILQNSSELHIAPISSNAATSPSARKSSTGVSIVKVNQLLRSVSERPDLFSLDEPIDITSRCLPRQFLEKDASFSSFLAKHPSVIFTSYSGAYTVCNVVSCLTADSNSKSRFAILIRVPKNSHNIEGLFKSAQSILNNKSESSLCSTHWGLDYILLQYRGISAKHFHELSTIIVEIKNRENCPETKLCSYFLSQIAVFPIVLSYEGLLLSFSLDGDTYTVRIIPDTAEINRLPNYKEICFAFLQSTKLEFREAKEFPEELDEKPEQSYCFGTSSLGNFIYQDEILSKCEMILNANHKDSEIPAKILLLGSQGSGKTSILMKVASLLSNSPLWTFASYIDCNNWKGKQAESIEKTLRSEIRKLEVRQPSILLLDNLDFFQLQNEEEQRQIAVEKIFQLIRFFLINSNLPILVTARKRTSLHKSLTAAGGIRLFSQVLEIAPLTQAQRCDILRELVEPDCDVSLTAKVTENFTIADLKKLAVRVKIEATIRGATQCGEKDFQKALKSSRPAGQVVLQNLNEKKTSLKDVGGLEKQKQLLTEVLLWPTKYSEIYESCEIQLGRGVVLHGPSGCGKTLLAKSFSNDTNFNVIFVKGPELLSKYIGSSEENVRQVFERARASAPCIILFDELDSLAPRRGNDSTGVTDRVVNQLLTELDGAEGLQGVYVIGCTSRLDLIDPALTRPGRFDHIVECGLPTQDERMAILSVILRDIPHSEDLNFGKLAEMTISWTGADLKALITNSKFEAARRRNKEGGSSMLSINAKDIEAVFEESKPKERYQQQEEFRVGQRVTLA